MTASYTASVAFLETLKLAGVDVCFTNLGSDHPSISEAIAASTTGKIAKGRGCGLPRFISVAHEMVALAAAQGYYQATGKLCAVILHVDCGLLNAGGMIHNLFRGKCPAIIFSGLSPFTQEGEMRGSRSEFIQWVQDTHDQPGITRGYSKYSTEFRTGKNIAQVTLRAAQIAMSEPRGPVYLFGAREVMEEDLSGPVPLNMDHWQPVGSSALPPSAVEKISSLLINAKSPLVVTSWLGNNPLSVEVLIRLAEKLSIPVVDGTPFALNFPTQHDLYCGSHWTGMGQNALLEAADVILLVDSDVPWIQTQNKPNENAIIIHIDADPLKAAMPLFYIPASHRYTVSSYEALLQLDQAITSDRLQPVKQQIESRLQSAKERASKRKQTLVAASSVPKNLQGAAPAAIGLGCLTQCLPDDRFIVCEAISNFGITLDQMQMNGSARYVTSGASSLGYHGGAAVGAKLAFATVGKDRMGKDASKTFVCAITGDGSYMFSVPSSVYHLASKLDMPIMTVILVNGGWKSPRLSTLLVHPQGIVSQSSGMDLGVTFGPEATRPQYGLIAQASAGGESKCWVASVVSGATEMESVFKQAVEAVQGGRSAVVELVLPDLDA